MIKTTPTLGPEQYRARYAALKAQAQDRASTAPRAVLAGNSAVLDDAMVRHRETIPGGWYWPSRLKRGETLRIVNTTGRSSVSALFWSAADPVERLNVADTVKVQWTARLTKGRIIFSDMGRVLASITDDSYGLHDAIVGGSNARSNQQRFGGGASRNTRDNFLLGAAKLGLGPRDVPPCITFFAPVQADQAGGMRWSDNPCPPGAYIDLRAEMDLLMILSNCPHPLDPATDYDPQPVSVIIWQGPPPGADDYCRTATEETRRGFENTDRLLAS